MKNLFKNLMLVAVAAMAFTACQNDNNEVNEVVKKTVISGVLNIENDDTRSGFVGKNEVGNAYVSEWDGGETIKIYVDGYGSFFSTVDAEGRFEAEIDGEVNPSTSMTVCSPADAWDSQWSPTIASEQTPRANSVDPAVHVLQSASATISSSSITMSPQQACYGKMTVNVPDDFVIDYVDIQLRGLAYFSYEDTISLTLQADYVENNTFWFAIPSTYDVSEFTVTAYDANKNTVTKTVTIPENRELKFNWGRVSTFSVKDLEKVEEVPTADYTATNIVWNNNEERFELTGPNITSFYIKMNAADRPGNNSFAVGEYTGVNSRTTPEKQFSVYQKVGGGYAISWTDTSSASTMSIEVKNGDYLIYINYVALYNQGAFTLVYKGLPAGFVLPEGSGENGGDEPVNPEPSDAPKFVRAAITDDYKPQDKEITFYGNGINLYNLSLDFIGTFEYLEDESVILKEGVYDADVNKDSRIDTSYSSYNGGEVWDLTVTVSHVSSGYYIVVENVTSDEAGNNIVITKATYTGEIEGLAKPQVSGGDEPEQPEQPTPDPDPEPGDSLEGYNTVSFVSFSKGSYMGRQYNWIGDFVFDYMGSAITFTMCDYKGPMQAASKSIKEGVYTNNGSGANMETKELYNISIAGMTGNSGSTVEVSKDGSEYVFKMIMKTVNGEYKFYYKGAL